MNSHFTAVEPYTEHKALHAALWTVQVVLAVCFGVAGFWKVSVPMDELGRQMAWVNAAPEVFVRFIGVAEILGAVGLVAPGFTGMKPQLTTLAALCLTALMLLATGFHIARGELVFLPPPLILGTLSAFVAWGRWKKLPLAERYYW